MSVLQGRGRQEYSPGQLFDRLSLLPPLSLSYLERQGRHTTMPGQQQDSYFEVSQPHGSSDSGFADSEGEAPTWQGEAAGAARARARGASREGPWRQPCFPSPVILPSKPPYLLVNNVRHLHIPERLCKFSHTTPAAQAMRKKAQDWARARAAVIAERQGRVTGQTAAPRCSSSRFRKPFPLQKQTLESPIGTRNASYILAVYESPFFEARQNAGFPISTPFPYVYKTPVFNAD